MQRSIFPYVVLRDRRAPGGVPSRPHVGIINTDRDTPLNGAFASIRAFRTHGPIHTLFLVCHGAGGQDFRALVSRPGIGGMGLALGKGGVHHGNVAAWIAIRNTVQNIVVYACRGAETQPGYEGTSNDGKYLMGALALHTQATVYAADADQDASYFGKHGPLNFGAWEGQLWRFRPDGSGAQPVSRVPIGYTEMIAGLYA